jgi:fumarate reductase flavoprotein subunit
MKNLKRCFFPLALLLFITNCDTSANSPEVRYKPGTYTASAKGFISEIKVSVTFSEEKITAITIDEHNETIGRDRVASAIKSIPDAIVQSQSLEVDVVSGATYTSKAIKEAVKNCILEAVKDI